WWRRTMRPTVRPLAALALVALAAAVVAGQTPPSHVITNGQITARVYLPDPKAGFYRSTRFDWSGAIGALDYKGHQYYGPWFTKVTDIYDFGYDGPDDAV